MSDAKKDPPPLAAQLTKGIDCIDPGTGRFSHPVESGFPWWLGHQHYLNLFFMLLMIRSGLQILADHPRLYLDGGCTSGREWLRLRGPVPRERIWTAKDDSLALVPVES